MNMFLQLLIFELQIKHKFDFVKNQYAIYVRKNTHHGYQFRVVFRIMKLKL